MSTAFEQAYTRIRDMIMRGELRAEDPLIPDDLARLCGVSRTPVREAIFRLEAEMFVTRLDNKRMIVRGWSVDDIEVFVELRLRVGGYMAARAATRISDVELAEMRDLNDRLEQAIAEGPTEHDGAYAITSRFHEVLIAAAQSDRLTTISWQLANPAPLLRLIEQHSEQRLIDMLLAHRELVQAFEAGDAVWAEAAMVVLVRKTFRAETIAKLARDK